MCGMKRVIVCLDVRDGKTTKGIKFVENVDIGDPALMARKYYEEGVDELVFYDITASHERRLAILGVVEAVAKEVFIPFTVGGGISTVAQMREILIRGADKISVNSSAVKKPKIISEGAEKFGCQCIVLGMDTVKDAAMPSGYRVLIDGGRILTELDALEWALTAEKLGVGEIVLNSVDADGTKDGYELEITRLVSTAVNVPVVASGGAGKPEHLYEVLTAGCADAALVASIVHYNEYPLGVLKEHLHSKGVSVRL
jgi:cyclase